MEEITPRYFLHGRQQSVANSSRNEQSFVGLKKTFFLK